MKILLVQHEHFINGAGGTEKICSFLANTLSLAGHQVTIATHQDISGKPVYPLEDKVTVTNIFNPDIGQVHLFPLYNYKGKNPFRWVLRKIEKKRNKFRNQHLIQSKGGPDGLYRYNLSCRSKYWKSRIDEMNPDVIITMSIGSLLEITYQNTYDVPIVNSVNGRPDYDYTDVLWPRKQIETALLKESFKRLDVIQVLFESYTAFLPETFHGTTVVIPNPVPAISQESQVNRQKKERCRIINIGSLVDDCKKQSIAIDLFSRLSAKYDRWDLHLFGIGADYDTLQQRIDDYNLNDRIFLRGFTSRPLEELSHADIFIFPSRYEGFPLALTEAMASGLPSLGFIDCSGVNQLIKDEVTGFLCRDENEMLQRLEELMNSETLRLEMGINARTSMESYSEDKIAQQWRDLIGSLQLK